MEQNTLRPGIEERIARLEALLPIAINAPSLSNTVFGISLVLAGGATFTAERGLGIPNHPYQIVLGVLAVALAYHRGWLIRPNKVHQWMLAPVNALVLSMLFRLVIGGGKRQPLHWLKYPELFSQKPEGKWIPQWSLVWQAMPLTSWEIDFTVIQTFLLIVILIGALFDLELFVSLIAFLLILISLPIFASFEWAWVFPAILLASISLYLQSEGVSVRTGNPKA